MRPWLLCLWVSLAACRPAPEGMRWTEAGRSDLVISVDVSGKMQAVESDRVGPPAIPGVWNYKIAMLAEEGSVVEAQHPVLMFDPSDLQRRLENKVSERDSAARQLEVQIATSKVARQDEALAESEAQAELRKAKLKAEAPEGTTASIDLEKSKIELAFARRKIKVLRNKASSAARRDAAETKRWRRKRDRAQERVGEIEAAIDAMKVKAPRTGTVIHATNWQGEKKKVGDSAWRAETLLRVVSLEEMEAAGEIDEVDIARVAVGQTVTLRLDAQPDVELLGVVREVDETVGRVSAENPLKVARLTIELTPNDEARLRPGMRFRGKIEAERIRDAVLVPLDSIFPTPDGPMVRRTTAADGTPGGGAHPVPVELGARNAHEVVVLRGLEPGDRVLRREEDPS